MVGQFAGGQSKRKFVTNGERVVDNGRAERNLTEFSDPATFAAMTSESLQELLRRFVREGGEDLFAELVRQGGPLVWSVAMRRLQDAQLAEEVAQNVFVILAKKARTLASSPGLTAWLHRTATLEASNLARSRRRREQRHRTMANDPTLSPDLNPTLPPEDGNSVTIPAGPWLDEALDRLPAADRVLLLGRYFEKRGFHDLERECGKSEPALRKQTERALGKLRALLQRKTVPLSAAAVAGLLGTELSVSAVPASAAAAITAKAGAAGSAALSAVPAITHLTLLMSTPKATQTAAILILILLGTSALLSLNHSAQANEIQNLTRRLNFTRNALAARPASFALNRHRPPIAAPPLNENAPPEPMTGEWLVGAWLRSQKKGLYGPGDGIQNHSEIWRNLPESARPRILREIDDAAVPVSVRRGTAETVLSQWMFSAAERKSEQRDAGWFTAEAYRRKLPFFGNALRLWTVADPSAAWQWIQEATSADSLIISGAGESADFPGIALQKFASGLVAAGFESAAAFVQLREGMPEYSTLLKGLGTGLASNWDFSQAVPFLAAGMSPMEMRSILAPQLTDFLNAGRPTEMAQTVADMVNLTAFRQSERQALLRQALGAAAPESEGAALAAMAAASSPAALPENLAWLAGHFSNRHRLESPPEKPPLDPASQPVVAEAFAATAQALAAQGNAELARKYLERISDTDRRESVRKTPETTTGLTTP